MVNFFLIITGEGLGLNLSKEICIKMGGELDYTSEKGKGTDFRIRIPLFSNIGNSDIDIDQSSSRIALLELSLYRNNCIKIEKEEIQYTDIKTSFTSCDCSRILVVDDNPTNIYILTNLLKKIGRFCQTVMKILITGFKWTGCS